AGVVISASHNPYEDNGIKVFSGKGEKFTETVEREVEALVAHTSWTPNGGDAKPVATDDLVDTYVDHLRAVFPDAGAALKNVRLAVDCANGATTGVARRLVDALGLDARYIGDRPDGRNINLNCGSTHPEPL